MDTEMRWDRHHIWWTRRGLRRIAEAAVRQVRLDSDKEIVVGEELGEFELAEWRLN